MDEHERRASFQEDEIERKLRLGQHMELFPEVLDAVEVEPFRERRWRQLMLALYRSGRTVESLRQFQRLGHSWARSDATRPQRLKNSNERFSSRDLSWTGPVLNQSPTEPSDTSMRAQLRLPPNAGYVMHPKAFLLVV
jgi:hypothetical protein